VKKVALFLALSAVAVFADGFGIYAEGPAPMSNFGILYSSGFFGIKNGYNFTHSHSESENDSMKTNESDASSASVELSPMFIINASILNIEICPAYQFTMGDVKSTSYSRSSAGVESNSVLESKTYSQALKLNLLLSKEFAERYKLGVGSNLFRYSFGNAETESKTSSVATSTTYNTKPSGYTAGLVFYMHFSVYF
jgi:hypothetical protein